LHDVFDPQAPDRGRAGGDLPAVEPGQVGQRDDIPLDRRLRDALGEAGPSTHGTPWDGMDPLHRFVLRVVNERGCAPDRSVPPA
jgi:hypothetical protein